MRGNVSAIGRERSGWQRSVTGGLGTNDGSDTDCILRP